MSELTEVTVQTEQDEKIEKPEKPRTLKNVRLELRRLEKSREQKKAKIRTLTEEMKAENAKIKELEAVYDELYHEDLQKQITNAWFKKGGLSGGQIEKILQMSKQVKDKIDVLDVDAIVKAVNTAYEQKQNADAQPDETALHSDSAENKEKNNPENNSLHADEAHTETKSIISAHIPEPNRAVVK